MDFTKIRFYQLHKQNLIEKAATNDYQKLLKEHIGLHSTDYLTPYISLWARVKDFEPKVLFDDLNDPFNAIRIRAFRGTIFVVHKENLPTILAAAKIFQSSTIKNFEKYLLKNGLNLVVIEQEVVNSATNRNEFTIHELKKALSDHLIDQNFSYALRYLEFKGVLIRTNHRYIADRVIRYGLTKEWLSDIDIADVNPDEALRTLTLNYIKKFGPISQDDLAWWFPITKTVARKMLDALGHQLVSFDFNDQQYFMEQSDYQKFEDFNLKNNPATIINFLPYEDHFPKAFSVRSWFLKDEIAPLVYKEGTIYKGQIFPSIWLNGQIIGGWEMNWADKTKSVLKITITNILEEKNLSQQIHHIIENHRAELENFVNEKLVPLMKR